MSRISKDSLGKYLILLVCFLFLCSIAQAQTGVVRGTVLNAATNEPLIGANIVLQGTLRGAATDFDGAFIIKDLKPGKYTVLARFVGFTSERQVIEVMPLQTTEVKFLLEQDVLKTDEVVVTGLSGQVPREELGNSIAKVSGEELQKIPVTSALDALVGKVAGINVTKSSGTPGTGTYITLRGRRTVTGSSQPLYVVDGVPLDNTFIYDGSGRIQGANRGSDINPADIESIEILKGASAAAIYGARAANGVILITTKSGKQAEAGKLAKITISNSYGTEEMPSSFPLQTKYGQRIRYAPYTPGSTDSWGTLLPTGTVTYDHSKDVFRTGKTLENSISISGGLPTLKYLVSGTFTNQQGFVKKSDFLKQNLRFNLNYSPFESFGLKSNSNYITQVINLPQDGSNTSGILLGGLRTPPDFDNGIFLEADGITQRRYASYDNPNWTMEFNTYRTEISRFIHNTGFDYDFLEGMRLSGNVGWDRYNHFNFERRFFGASATTARQGDIVQNRYTNDVINTDVMLTSKFELTSDILSTIVLGQQLSFFTRNATGASSSNTLPFYHEIGAGVSRDAGSSRSESRIYSYYAQATFNAWEKITLTGAVRRDAGSTFGKAQQAYYYPKASIAYRLSQESFMQDLKGVVDEFKVRLAWGQAGRVPGTYATNRTYTTGGNFDPWGRSTSAGRSGQLGIRHDIDAGTDEVKPELTTEIETGFDATFLDRRINVEFSFYRQDVSQLLLWVDVPRSTGYNTQYRNAGEMWNQGFEIKVDINPIRSSLFNWVARVNYARNKNEVTKLEGFKNSYITLTGAFVGIYNIAKEGRPLGTWLGAGYERDANGQIIYSDPANPARQDNVLNPGIKGAPRFSSIPVELGKADPDWTGSLRNDFSFFDGAISASILFDAMWGHKVWNGTRGALYNFGTAKDTEDRDAYWFNELGQPVTWQGTAARTFGTRTYQIGDTLRREVYYRNHGNGFLINEPHIEDGSFIKLREISVSYTWRKVPFFGIESMIFTFSGRNLKTWTDYSGYDPEINTFQQAEGRGFDYFTLPQVRSFRFDLTINY